jgi:hypothetical protein
MAHLQAMVAWMWEKMQPLMSSAAEGSFGRWAGYVLGHLLPTTLRSGARAGDNTFTRSSQDSARPGPAEGQQGGRAGERRDGAAAAAGHSTPPQAGEAAAPQARARGAGASEGGGMCVVCIEREATAALVHGSTAHRCCCNLCADRLRAATNRCPVCRRQIDSVVRLYDSTL